MSMRFFKNSRIFTFAEQSALKRAGDGRMGR
jgi:hypothetical protein